MTGPPVAAARWVCCQLGAREHYAVPRALHRRGSLAHLITDAWLPPGSMVDALPGQQARRLSERYHPELGGAAVTHFTASLVARELEWRMRGRSGWPLFIERNQWFQRQAAAALGDSPGLQGQIVFAHSYAALEIFQRARAAGARCVLGQIDPGAAHFEIVRDAALAAPEYGPPPASPPPEYLSRWHEECGLADQIVVNSEWSRSCLERAGIPAAKLRIVPLAYEPESTDMAPRNYPSAFSVTRPLRILFVGQVSVAKGAAALLDAVPLLQDLPVKMWLVGPVAMSIPQRFLDDPALRWVGAVSRREVMEHYRDSDVLVFPTLSDGFGMAQVEAQGWGLPVIASRRSGRVVEDDVTGLVLDDPCPAAIASAIRRIAGQPQLLQRWSANALGPARNAIERLGSALAELEQ